ncbi:MAG: DUF1552 domain-containing protein [Myxococcota bacterium]
MRVSKGVAKAGRCSRRELFRRYGPAALLIAPVVRHAVARAAPPSERRFVQIFLPNGTRPSEFWPTSSGFDLSGSRLAPFESIKHKMLVFRGVNAAGSIHAMPSGLFTNGSTSGGRSGQTNGASLDWAFADAVQAGPSPTPFHSIQIGIDTPYPNRDGCSTTRDGSGRLQPVVTDPARLFDHLFGGLSGSGDCSDTPASPPAATAYNPRRSRLDALRESLASAQRDLGFGPGELSHLDEFESGVRDLELRLPSVDAEGSGAGTSPAIECGDVGELQARSRSVAKANQGEFFGDLVALAFQLDLTRSAAINFFSEGGDTDGGKRTNVDVASWFRVRDGRYDPDGERVDTFHHHLSHYNPSSREGAWDGAVNRWAYETMAHLALRLDGLPGASGTMLDDSLMMYMGSGGDGARHRPERMPCVILGSAGGVLPQGEMRDAGGVLWGRALATAAAALGLEGGTFGPRGGAPLA